MTSLGSIEERAIKHICLVGNRDAMVQEIRAPPHPEERPFGRVLKDEER
jgi:hypothetical protein